MADTKISALSAATALDGTEVAPVVQSAATVKATVQQIVTAATGSSTISGATVTASTPLLDHAQTWNNSGVTFTGWNLNITNTASGGSSLLVDLQVGGTSKFNVRKDGFYNATGALFLFGNNSQEVTVNYYYDGIALNGLNSGVRFGPSAGVHDTGFVRNSAKVLEVNDTLRGSFVGTALVLGPQTVAQLPAAASGIKGARATVTDATVTVFMSAVVGSGGNTVPVFCDGTNWLIG